MEKIALAIAKMNERRDLMTKVIKKGSEYYFLFNEKHKWSILLGTNPEKFHLYYYTLNQPIEEIAGMTTFTDDMYVYYPEEKLRELNSLTIVRQLYEFFEASTSGIDKALDDILNL